MRAPIPIYAVNLSTLERKLYPSTNAAARHLDFHVDTVRIHLNNDTPFNGWYFCHTADIEAKAERIRYLGVKWRSEGMPLEAQRKQKVKLVSLRIDSHTVILVKPEKATPEYAEQYRQKLLKNSRKY